MSRRVLGLLFAIATLPAFAEMGPKEARDHAIAFLAQNVHGKAASEMKERDATTSGRVNHFNYIQLHGGVAVYGAYAKVHVRPDGSTVGNINTYEIRDDIDTKPVVTLRDAERAAAGHLLITGAFVTGDEELVILPKRLFGDDSSSTDTLAWVFLIGPSNDREAQKSSWVAVDAQSGRVVFSRVATVQAAD